MSESGSSPWWRSRRIEAASSASFVVTAPPSPVVTILRGWKERQPIVPSPPHGIPCQRAPSAPAASSSSTISGETASWSADPVERTPEEMHREHRLRPRRHRLVDALEIEVERVGIDVDEHGLRSGEPDDVRRRREGVGRDDHLVASQPNLVRSRARARRGGAPQSRSRRRLRARPRRRRRRAPRAPPPSAPSSGSRSGEPRRPPPARPRRRPAARAGSLAQASAGLRSRYHAIVLASPSSRSTFASKPSTSRAFSTFGIRSSTSA